MNRVDPDGMTDFKLNQQTGEVSQVGDKNDDPDRMLKTDNKGNVKTKGHFLVRKSEQGKPKVEFGVEKGILKDGMNFQTKDNVIDVGGKGQPSKEGVENFALNMSNYIGKEIGGYLLSNKGEDDISHVLLGRYRYNDAETNKYSGNLGSVRPDLVGNVDFRVDFHTHLSRFKDEDRLYPSGRQLPGGDLESKRNQLQINPSMKFIIITNPEPLEHEY